MGGLARLNDITRRYVERMRAGRPSSGTLTAAAEASQMLRTAYKGRFLGRPAFFGADDIRSLEPDLNRLYDLLVSLPERLFSGDLRRYSAGVGMNAAQIEAVLRLRADRPLRLGRADLYQESDGFKVLEVNVGSPLGGIENAELNRVMLGSSELASFVAEEGLDYHDTLAGVARTLLYHCERSQAETRPVVAIVDAPASFAELGPRLCAVAQLFCSHGLDAFACNASQVMTKGNRLVADGRAIDVVYRWFVLEDLQSGSYELELFEPILTAYELGHVAVFAPFDTELYGNKRALALLSDHRHQEAFTEDEQALVDRLVPWTRELSSDPTTVGTDEVDMLDYCRAHRADLLLKPSMASGGAGISPGWLMRDHEWHRALEQALDRHYVVQRRVRPVTEPFVDEPTGSSMDVVLNWGVFLNEAGYNGAYVRGCADPDVGVVSRDAGARFGCCFSPQACEYDRLAARS